MLEMVDSIFFRLESSPTENQESKRINHPKK